MPFIFLLNQLNIMQNNPFSSLFNTFTVEHECLKICLKQKAKDSIVELVSQSFFNPNLENLILTTAF